jgi:hypothetical protein
MMAKRWFLGLALSLAAAPALAFTPDRAALMVDAVRANGCAMTSEQAEGALAPLGLDGVEVQMFVDTLYGAGLVTMSDDMEELLLAPQLCEAAAEESLALIVGAFEMQDTALEPWRPTFTPERGAEFIAALRGVGCSLTEAGASDVLVPLGFSQMESRDVVTVLIDSQLAGMDDQGVALTLSDALCAADPATDVPTLAAILAEWDETHPPGEVHIQRGGDQ